MADELLFEMRGHVAYLVLYRGLTVSKADGLAMAQHILAPIKFSEDIKEGPRAFAEKRQPQWQGR